MAEQQETSEVSFITSQTHNQANSGNLYNTELGRMGLP